MKNIYGFKVSDRNGNGFKRWFNGDTELTTDNPLGKLPENLNLVNNAQDVMQFTEAYHYCFKAVIKYNLQFTLLNETDWNDIKSPLKKLINKILNGWKIKKMEEKL